MWLGVHPVSAALAAERSVVQTTKSFTPRREHDAVGLRDGRRQVSAAGEVSAMVPPVPCRSSEADWYIWDCSLEAGIVWAPWVLLFIYRIIAALVSCCAAGDSLECLPRVHSGG